MAVVKSADAFRTISEASNEIDVPQHVLRHWEEVFGQIRPMRRAGGRRYYRPLDLDVLRGVRVLLYDQRYTTRGVQKIFREHGVKYVAEIGRLFAAGQSIDLRPILNEEETDREETASHNETSSTDPGPSEDNKNGLGADTRSRLSNLLQRLESTQSALDEAMLALEAMSQDTD